MLSGYAPQIETSKLLKFICMHQTFSQLSVGVTTEAETMVAEAAAPPVVVKEAAAPPVVVEEAAAPPVVVKEAAVPTIALLLACLVGDI